MSRKLNEDAIRELLEEASDVESDAEHDSIRLCVDEIFSDIENAESVSGSEDSIMIHGDDTSSSEEDDEADSSRYYRGKNRYIWSKIPPSNSRTRRHNIITYLPGLIGEIRDKTNMSPLESWQLLITDEIINIICIHTNKKITEFSEKYTSQGTHSNHVSLLEMRAFLGLLLLAGVFKSGHEDVESLWATDSTGRDVFRVTLSLKRFLFLLSALRFDDIDTRAERRENDRTALISEVFNKFIQNCQNVYTCSEYITVDEMLCPFRGRCLFRVYMKSKPAKYGIKIMCLCDSKTHYLYNAFIYSGKCEVRGKSDVSVPTQTVMSLAEPILKTNRNITGDNWFSSIELVDKLKQNGLTYVGTLRKNKREIPPEFLPHKNRPSGSTLFGYTKSKTLASYVPKKNQSVVMISSMHHDGSVDPESGKPEIIHFYNSTKGGVDSLDQKCANYSVSRRTQRWPFVIFSAILNISTANGFVLWKASNLEKRMKRNQYIKQIGIDLVAPFVRERQIENSKLSTDLKKRIENFLQHTQNFENSVTDQPRAENLSVGAAGTSGRKRGRCYLCDRKKDQKQSQKCIKCCNYVCNTHLVKTIMCSNCQI